MNRIDKSLDQMSHASTGTTAHEQIAKLRQELELIIKKARAGVITDAESDRCTDIGFELRDLGAR